MEMDRLPGALLSINLDDAISRDFSKQIQEDFNVEDEDEDDEYLYDEPPPYDIGAKLVEINAELANFHLPHGGRTRRVTFQENPVQSEIPPTPTDSTDEDDGYGDSTEASDDADGFCTQAIPGGAHQSDDVGHLDLQRPLIPIHPTDGRDASTVQDDVSKMMMFVKQRKDVRIGTESSTSQSSTSLAEELNLFLKSFSEMAIKNGAESLLEDFRESLSPPATNVRGSEEFQDVATQNNDFTSNKIDKLDESTPDVREESRPVNEPEDDVIKQEQMEAELWNEAHDPIRSDVNGSADSIKNPHDYLNLEEVNISNTATSVINSESSFDEFDNKPGFCLPSGMLTLTNSAPRSPKVVPNSMSNFLKWKRAFRMIHRKTKASSSQWNMTVDEILKNHHDHSPINSNTEQPNNVVYCPVPPETSPTFDPTHASQEQINSLSPEGQNKMAKVDSNACDVSKTEVRTSTSSPPNSTLIVSPPKMATTIPLPAIGSSPRMTPLTNGSESEPMIMTSQDGQFCMMTTEDFQSSDGQSAEKLQHLNNSSVHLSTRYDIGSGGRRPVGNTRLTKTFAATQRPLKVGRATPEGTKGHQPLLRKSNSTLSPGTGFGKSAVGKPYSRGTFPVKVVSGVRSRSASASGGRRWDGSEFESRRDAQLKPDCTKNIFPPHGYGLSEEQKQERERKMKKIEADRLMKKQRESEERQRRKHEGEEAFQAWLRTKRKEMLAPSNSKDNPTCDLQGRFISHNKDSGMAFQEWLKRKKEQKQEERRVEEFKLMVEEQMHYIRTREQNDLAFRKWLRRKRNRNGRVVDNL